MRYLPTLEALVTLGLHRRMLYWQQEAHPAVCGRNRGPPMLE